jgi:uncharacterized membrane protein YhiD involved in acid resistance
METDIYIRLIVAMILGMVIGIERIIAHKTAGVQTYTLVTVGAALFSIISQFIYTIHPDASFNSAYIPAAEVRPSK